MIRLAAVFLATLTVAVPGGVAAQTSATPSGTASRTLDADPWCTRDRGGDYGAGRRAQACEVREVLLSAAALDLDGTPNGSVTVKRWDRPDVLVRARVRAYARTEADARQSVRATRLQAERGTVRAVLPRAGRPDGSPWTTVSYEVFAPRRTSLAVRTQNGAISVHGLDGGVRLRALNGAIALADVGGDVQAETVNGAVSVSLSDGWSGDGIRVQTVNGAVSLSLSQGVSADLEAQTRVGRIALAGLDVTGLDRERGRYMGDRVEARLGRGGAPVQLATTNGSISIRQSR